MSNPRYYSTTVTTSTGGAATAYIPVFSGQIQHLHYAKDTFASTADITVTTEDTGQAIWSVTNSTASASVYPVAAANLPSGAASTITEVPIFAANERVKIVVAQGGNTKSGTITIVSV